MRRYFLITILLLGWAANLFPCADVEIESIFSSNDLFCEAVPHDDDFDYLIENEECRDFQRFYNHYCFGCYKRKPNSGNMEEWAKYLKIDAEQAYYLVNKSSQQAIDSLLAYGSSNDPQLKFADKAFCKKWRNALTYISFAKYLEPYMSWENGDEYYLWRYPYKTGWSDPRRPSILNLDYSEVLDNMIEAYGRQKDKELKIRYGYQIVRFAHYNGQYEDAVRYFDKYVESLNYKPEIYYYALSQKAGALCGYYRTEGGGDSQDQANGKYAMDFLKVFTYSKDLKFAAYKSLRGEAWEYLYDEAKSLPKREACSLYFMLGFNYFNNGLKELEKIASLCPDSYMADVLMSGYIASLYLNEWNTEGLKDNNLKHALGLAETILQKSPRQDFWHLCAAHLSAYEGMNDRAKQHLSKVKSNRPCFKANKDRLSTYMAITDVEEMTREAANNIYGKHEEILKEPFLRKMMAERMDSVDMEMQRDLLSFEYLKGFDSKLWEKAIAFGTNPNLNSFEKWLLKCNNYSLDSVRGELSRSYLHEGNIPKALEYARYYKTEDMPLKSVFCYNVDRTIWELPEENSDFHSDYTNELIDKKLKLDKVSYVDLLKQLDALYKTAQTDGDKGAKAAFLLGNFYYNIGPKGYYRDRIFGFGFWNIWARGEDNVYGRYKSDKKFLEMADKKSFQDDELRAKIVFAMAKVDGENHGKPGSNYQRLTSGYKRTKAYKTFVSKCSYFSKYVND